MALNGLWNMFTDLVGTHAPHVARVTQGGAARVTAGAGWRAVPPRFAAGGGPNRPGGPALPVRWGRDRVALLESLWGDGFTFPDGEQETLRLVMPLTLSNASSLLLVGVGAGGPACCIATQLGAWVTGYEADLELAAVATERSFRSGLGRRAEMKTWDPATPNFSRRSFHHALLLEALRGAPPGPVLVGIFRALRPGGQLMIVDLVADQPLDPRDAEVAAWCELENRPSTLPSQRAITGGLGRLGFDVRVTEDISLRHMQQALRGWHTVIRGMAAQKPSPAMATLVVREAELWLRRLSLMRARRIRMVRWHAIRGTASA